MYDGAYDLVYTQLVLKILMIWIHIEYVINSHISYLLWVGVLKMKRLRYFHVKVYYG